MKCLHIVCLYIYQYDFVFRDPFGYKTLFLYYFEFLFVLIEHFFYTNKSNLYSIKSKKYLDGAIQKKLQRESKKNERQEKKIYILYITTFKSEILGHNIFKVFQINYYIL